MIGVFLYSLGGYIKKYKPLNNIKNHYLIITILLFLIIDILSYRNMVLSDISNLIASNNLIYYQNFYVYSDYNFIPIIIAICIFELFRRIKIKKIVFINHISSSTLLIYMLHENCFVRSLLKRINFVRLLHDDFIKFIIIYFIITVMIFITGYIFYVIYTLIINKIKLFKNA